LTRPGRVDRSPIFPRSGFRPRRSGAGRQLGVVVVFGAPALTGGNHAGGAVRLGDDDGPGVAVAGGQDLDQAALVGDADGDRGLAILLGQVAAAILMICICLSFHMTVLERPAAVAAIALTIVKPMS
jgi:hypothetical protein